MSSPAARTALLSPPASALTGAATDAPALVGRIQSRPDPMRQRIASGHLGVISDASDVVAFVATDRVVHDSITAVVGRPSVLHTQIAGLTPDLMRRMLVPQTEQLLDPATMAQQVARPFEPVSPISLAVALQRLEALRTDGASASGPAAVESEEEFSWDEEDAEEIGDDAIASLTAEAQGGAIHAPDAVGLPVAWPVAQVMDAIEDIQRIYQRTMDNDLLAFLVDLRRQERARNGLRAAEFASGRVWPEEVVDALEAGTPLVQDVCGVPGLSRVERVTVTQGQRGPLVVLHLLALGVGREGGLSLYRQTRSLQWWKGAEALTTMGIAQPTETQYAQAAAAGRMLEELAMGAVYRATQSTFYVGGAWRLREITPGPRVVIDPVGLGISSPEAFDRLFGHLDFSRIDDNEGDDGFGGYDAAAATTPAGLVAARMLRTEAGTPDWAMAIPLQPAWGLKARAWGLLALRDTTPVTPCSRAYDRLVLAEGRKELVLALIEHGPNGFTDIIDGKSGGCIFLLEGSPGTGKTLTAEAAAERLGRPLYMVAVGELGTDAPTLEERLTEILGLAARWKAVVLLDEADIFLERRRSGDVQQNALVSIFLRQLEYYGGVLFLTSNRASDLDPALASRLALRLPFPALTEEARHDVWRSLLGAAGSAGIEVPAAWAARPMNGRSIKNAIRLAAALARSEGQAELDAPAIERVLILLDRLGEEITAHEAAREDRPVS